MLSPNRQRENLSHSSSSSLPTSLSRKLRSNGSLKGGQTSPMFPPVSTSGSRNGGKRKGGSFESQEPSSPKVTCIGQVRIKRKLGRKKLSRNNSVTQCCITRNSKRVYFPLSICEGFSCLLPCRSGLCFSEKEGCSRCCDGICGRWVGEDTAKERKIEEEEGREIVGEREEGREIVGEREEDSRTCRRHVFQEIEFKDGGDGVSIIPPKNALLLMRCRSDPVKMEALAKKFFEVPPPTVEHDEVEDDSRDRRGMEIDAPESRGDEKLVTVEDNVVEGGNNTKLPPSEIEEVDTDKSTDVCQTVVNSREVKEGDGCEESREDDTSREEPKDLPDCLLLMMCEPKLSMEVSKETWVCSSDFIRTVPGGRSKVQSKKTDAVEEQDSRKRCTLIRETAEVSGTAENRLEGIIDEEGKNETDRGKITSEKQWKLHPHRSSCHYPARPLGKGSMASAIEKKLEGSNGYEPFVLTRCNSEPMRAPPPRKSDGAAVSVRVATASGI